MKRFKNIMALFTGFRSLLFSRKKEKVQLFPVSRFTFHILPDFRTFGLVLSIVSCLLSNVSQAQVERSLTRNGNKLFDKGKYSDAEASYKKALDKKNNFTEAIFNLGDAQYKQNRYEEAGKQFQLASKVLTDSKLKASAFHNLGNTFLEQKKYEDAVTAYKQALKVNANDLDTKYNLAYANAMLKQKNQSDKDNKDKKDGKSESPKDDKDKKDGKDGKPESPKDDKGDKEKDKKEQQLKKGNGPELSKEQAEKLLEALKNEEQKTQQKMQQKNAKPQDVKIEKDW